MKGDSRAPRARMETKSGAAKRQTPREREKIVSVFIARGGAAKGDPDYEVPFASRAEALAFLANQHGLDGDERKRLAKTSALRLNRRWHGSVGCRVIELRLPPDKAQGVLKGDLLA